MTGVLRGFLGACAVVGVLVGAAAAQPVDVSEALKPLTTKHGVPGMAALVIRGGDAVASGVAGVRAAGGEAAVEAGDLWHIGSCTKAMTATMLATFVDEGVLAWTSTVGEKLADVPMDAGWKDVTLEQLLAHRAGVAKSLDADGLWGRLWNHQGTEREQRQVLVAALLAKPPLSAPGEKFLYANAGFTIAAAMAERAADKAWEDLMRERLFGPLGMKSAGFGAPGVPGEVTQPRGHDGEGKPVEPGPNHAGDNPAAIGPGGTVHLSMEDWGRFAALHLAGERGTSTVVKPETLRGMHRPYNAPGSNYGWGWIFTERPWGAGRVFTHGGSNTLWMAVVWVAPEKNMAVLVACNRGGDGASKACDEAAGLLARRFIEPESVVAKP